MGEVDTAAAGAQRRADAAARRRGGPGDDRVAHPQGRHQRGVPRLGDQRRHHPLLLRHRRRAASVPADGARLPAVIGAGGARADPGADRPAARRRRRLRRRRFQRDRHLPRLPRRPGGAAGRLRGRRRRASRPAGTRRPSPAARRARSTARCSYLLQDDDGQTIESHSISAGPGLPGRRPGARLARRTPAAPSTGRSPTPRRWTRSRCCRRTEGIIPAIESAHAVAGALELGRELGPGRDHRGEPVRPRRQGHGHRRKWFGPRGRRRPSRVSAGSRDRRSRRRRAGAAGRAGRLPARRFPDVSTARSSLTARHGRIAAATSSRSACRTPTR